MKKTSFRFLRIGLAITFLWIGILIFKNPEAWSGYLQPWAAGLLPVPMAQAMIGTAILDIIIGVFLLIDFLTWLMAILGSIHLVIVLTVSGITDITVRDVGLLVAVLSLAIESFPQSILLRVSFLKKNLTGALKLFLARKCSHKIIITIVIVLVVSLAGFFIFKGSGIFIVSQSIRQQTVPSLATLESSIRQSDSQTSVEQSSAVAEKIVTYTDVGYSPAILRIKKGEIVIFKNQSSRSMWTASASHPSHRLYPTTGGCLGSTFDACKGILPGNNWSFKVDISGSWNYHNHLRPNDTGTIVAE